MLFILASIPPTLLRSILNAAPRLLGDMQKCAHILGFLRDSLHWLRIQRQFKTVFLKHNCTLKLT